MTERTFGVEMEMVGVTKEQVAAALTAAGIPCQTSYYGSPNSSFWKAQPDGSVQVTHANQGQGSCELVSPILRGEAGLATIRRVCAVLATINAKVNKKCGLHVHMGARDLSHDEIKKICKIWVRDENIIDMVMPVSRRANNNRYCRSNLTKDTSAYNEPGTAMYTVDDMFNRISSARTFQQLQYAVCPIGRYHKLNLCAFAEHGTIEFRQHSGTVEADKICYWIEFLDSMIAEARTRRTIGRRSTETGLARMAPPRRVILHMSDMGVTSECAKFFRARAELLNPTTTNPVNAAA